MNINKIIATAAIWISLSWTVPAESRKLKDAQVDYGAMQQEVGTLNRKIQELSSNIILPTYANQESEDFLKTKDLYLTEVWNVESELKRLATKYECDRYIFDEYMQYAKLLWNLWYMMWYEWANSCYLANNRALEKEITAMADQLLLILSSTDFDINKHVDDYLLQGLKWAIHLRITDLKVKAILEWIEIDNRLYLAEKNLNKLPNY